MILFLQFSEVGENASSVNPHIRVRIQKWTRKRELKGDTNDRTCNSGIYEWNLTGSLLWGVGQWVLAWFMVPKGGHNGSYRGDSKLCM